MKYVEYKLKVRKDEDFKYVVLNLDNMYSIDSYSIKYINKIRKN